jgi:DNA-directed RNA polymerase subunit omega
MEHFNPFFRIMTTSLLDEATKMIPNPQVLINVVSKRVRQLTQGHRPMVEVGARLDYADIALREIIEGKISYELVPEDEKPS